MWGVAPPQASAVGILRQICLTARRRQFELEMWVLCWAFVLCEVEKAPVNKPASPMTLLLLLAPPLLPLALLLLLRAPVCLFRGANLDGAAAARAVLAQAAAAGGRVVAFFCESIISCGGQVGGDTQSALTALRFMLVAWCWLHLSMLRMC